MARFFRDNGLTLALLLLFAISIVGQLLSGLGVATEEALQHGREPPTAIAYLGSGDFLSAVFENWESEFLQMAAFVILTSFLIQRGSPESKDPDGQAPQDQDPRLHVGDPDAPAPLRWGKAAIWLYSRSLGVALGFLFLASFLLHLRHSTRLAGERALDHGQTPPGVAEHLASAQFWFESFQNWQSEFMSTAALIILSIFLRQIGSPQSKPVAAPHSRTGA
jgi:hypothetical protein